MQLVHKIIWFYKKVIISCVRYFSVSYLLVLHLNCRRATRKIVNCESLGTVSITKTFATSLPLSVRKFNLVVIDWQSGSGLIQVSLIRYIDCIRGKHERLFIVSEHYTQSVANQLNTYVLSIDSEIYFYSYSSSIFVQQHASRVVRPEDCV